MHNENAILRPAAIFDTRNQAYDATMENDQRRHHRLCRPPRAGLGPALVNLTGPSILADHLGRRAAQSAVTRCERYPSTTQTLKLSPG
jgi:hypothetical protein